MKNITMVTAVIAALVFLVGISVAAGEYTVQPKVLEHGETGISTNVVYTAWINNNFAGFDDTDLQAKIKQFIYNSHLYDTEHIILAGDVDRVPARYVYVNDTNQNDGKYMPCDLYYVDLCDWDPDDDGKCGAIDVSGVVPTDTPDTKPEVSTEDYQIVMKTS